MTIRVLGRISKQYINGKRKRKATLKLISSCIAAVIVIVSTSAWSPRPATTDPRAVGKFPDSAVQAQSDSVNQSSPLVLSELPEAVAKYPPESRYRDDQPQVAEAVHASACDGRRVYTYPLPSSMNTDLLKQCDGQLVGWIKFCVHYTNHGFGAPLNTTDPVFRRDWYATDAYMLEVIYYERMQHYPCLTHDAREADIFFIPYFSGLDALPYLYRDDHRPEPQGRQLVAWLAQNATETWSRYGGRDHFFVGSRTAWDFFFNSNTKWGSKLFLTPELKNVPKMVVEREPWHETQIAIPYPIGFHPSSYGNLAAWIEVVRSSPRPHLFAFTGALRPGMASSIRGILSQQCTDAGSACTRLDCSKISCGHNPEPIYKNMLSAAFCLQPRGDSATRRSVSDSVVAGCVPVFFHDDTARSQYWWHFPHDYENFSVFIPESSIKDGSEHVQRVLESIPADQVERMRERLIAIMARMFFRHPLSTDMSLVRDAFDVSMDAMAERVATLKAQSLVEQA